MEIKNIKEIKPAKWSGGSTYQILILPKEATVKEDFSIRISSATIEAGESNFSDFSGYNRFLTILSGSVELKHENEKWQKLTMHMPYYFDGGIKTQSRSTVDVVDFNVIWKKSLSNIEVEIVKYEEYTEILEEKIPNFLFSLKENSYLNYANKDYVLNKWDYINLKNEKNIKLKGHFIMVRCSLL